MHRTVTALYRSRSTAELLRRELMDRGVPRDAIHLVPDARPVGELAVFGATVEPMEALSALTLSREDLRNYENRIRNGDYLVSVSVDSRRVALVEEIMREPENFALKQRERRRASMGRNPGGVVRAAV